jgi:hypothetical protein
VATVNAITTAGRTSKAGTLATAKKLVASTVQYSTVQYNDARNNSDTSECSDVSRRGETSNETAASTKRDKITIQ